ncbi:MAG: MFS transporter, partial [Candidatus Binatia bacterium]
IVATAIAVESSWRVALRVLAVGGWIVILPFALWVVRERGRADSTERAPGESANGADDLELAEAMRTPSFWILCGVLFSFYFYYIGVNNHLVAFLSDSGFTEAEAARRFGAAVAVGILGKIGVGLVADRIPKRAAIVATFTLMTAGSFALLFVGEAPALLPAFLIVHGFTVAAENVVLPLIVADCFGVRHLARIYGAIMLMLLPGGVLGPVFAGYAFDTFGSYRVAFTTFAIVNVAAVAALALIRPLAANRERLKGGSRWPSSKS